MVEFIQKIFASILLTKLLIDVKENTIANKFKKIIINRIKKIQLLTNLSIDFKKLQLSMDLKRNNYEWI